MNLYNDVYQLLSENDCVIIPGFGGFVVNYNEAVVNITGQRFYPPSRTLAFNEKLQVNDGLFINHICQTQGLNWKVAKENLSVWVSDMNDKLDEGNTIDFDKLGTFNLVSGNLVFSPDKSFGVLESSYGLNSFYFPMLKSGNELMGIHKPRHTTSVKKQKKSRRKLVYILSAAAVLTGLIAVSLHFDLFDFKTDTEYANVVPVERMINNNSNNGNDAFPDYRTIIGEEVVYIDPELVTDEYIAENFNGVENTQTFVEPVEVVETDVQLVTEINHNVSAYIIAGSFSGFDNAENFQQKYQDSGFSAEILPKSNGMYRVAIKSYTDSDLAVEELSGLKNKTGNYSLWILKI